MPRLARFFCHSAKATGQDGVRVRAGDTETIWGNWKTLIVLWVDQHRVSILEIEIDRVSGMR